MAMNRSNRESIMGTKMEHPSHDLPSVEGGEWWADEISRLVDQSRTDCGDCTSAWDQDLGGGIVGLCYEFQDGRFLCVTEDIAALYPSYEMFMDGESDLFYVQIGEDESGNLYTFV